MLLKTKFHGNILLFSSNATTPQITYFYLVFSNLVANSTFSKQSLSKLIPLLSTFQQLLQKLTTTLHGGSREKRTNAGKAHGWNNE